jgi:hypothetical protein
MSAHPRPLRTAYPPATRGRVVLWGLLAQSPFGGMTWQVLHHLGGLRRLGFDVWYVEDSDRPVYDPETFWGTFDVNKNVEYLARQMERLDLGDRWVFRPPDTADTCLGACDMAGLAQLYKDADAVLNLCGAQELRPGHREIRCLVYLETDPVASQIRVASGEPATIEALAAYDVLFTYGENLGAADCGVPVDRFSWQPTRPPVCVDWWATDAAPPTGAALTTVANWKHTGKDIVWQGETYRWSKHHEFLRFIDLPRRSAVPLELALGAISEDETTHMRARGWRIIPSADLAQPDVYRDYIRSSYGEFTVAKDQNIRLRSGWFSDRSASYLAAGRPVITQDTGFANILPTGEGLFAFTTLDEAAMAVEAVRRDYSRHAAAARQIADEFFAAERVLGAVFRRIGLL